jgi:trk system potassium uptake protein TrkH
LAQDGPVFGRSAESVLEAGKDALIKSRFQPAQMLAFSFLGTILLGTLLLWLPASARSERLSLIDAAFTSTSAVCVTGLTVRDTSSAFSPFGQGVILGLIQLGGLGIMTFSTMILLVAGRKIAIADRVAVQEDFSPVATKDFRSLIRDIFLYAMAIEAAGSLLLLAGFLRRFPLGRAIPLAVFHSVSAFCNAGFTLFSDNLAGFRGDGGINVTIIALIVLGGLGFLVLKDVTEYAAGVVHRKRARLMLHSKLVLTMTLGLILIGFGLFLGLEGKGALAGLSTRDKVLASLFQAVTPRTAGFNTIDLAAVGSATGLLLMVLMFIGASPGSTGGGVKTSTIGVLAAFLRSKIMARDSVGLFRRTLPAATILRALTAVLLALALVFLASFLILVGQPDLGMRNAVFEVFSAFGTVGLSLGATARLNGFGKIVIILTMFIGRIGPLALLSAFSRQRAKGRFDYAEESVMTG